MKPCFHRWLFPFCVAVSLSSCVTPKPQRFVDAATLPSDFAGREHRATATGQRLAIEVSQIQGLNVTGFEIFEHDGELYLSPRYVSTGGYGIVRFEVDVRKYGLKQNWSQHVYWLLQYPSYPIGHPGFWSNDKRSPMPRKKLQVRMLSDKSHR